MDVELCEVNREHLGTKQNCIPTENLRRRERWRYVKRKANNGLQYKLDKGGSNKNG
jgi:hypothetical protein